MKQSVALALVGVFCTLLPPRSLAVHGGAYPGPPNEGPPPASGPTTPGGGPPTGGGPPGGGGGGGGAYGGPADTGGAGTPKGPATPGPAAPTTPGGGPGGKPAPAKPGTGGITDVDTTDWRVWWYYNSKSYLDLKRSTRVTVPVTGSDDFYLGRGEHADHSITDATRARIVPHLLELLAHERSNHIVTSAMLALAKLGASGTDQTPAQLTAAIQPRLADANQTISEVAAVSLGILGDDQGVLALAALLADDAQGQRLCGRSRVDERTRAFAAYALGLIGERTARVDVRRFVVQKLCAAFEADRGAVFDVRVAALLALGLVQLPSDPAWAPPEEGSLSPARCREAQVEWVLQVLADGDQAYLVRAHAPTSAARLLAGLANEALRARVVERLLDELAARSAAPREVRQGCTLALGEICDADADALDAQVRERLVELSKDAPDQQQRAFALMALARAGGRPGSGAGDALAGVGAIREHFSRSLTHGKGMMQPWSALAIGVMERALDEAGGLGSTDMKELLRAALAEEAAPGTMGALCIALGILRDTEARTTVAATLERTGDPDTRAYVLLALGMLRERESIPVIQRVLEESRYNAVLVQNAAIALALIHDPGIVPDLLAMLDKSTGLATSASLCYSLGRIGDARAIDALVALSVETERTDLARGMATEALGALADRDDLPWNTALAWAVNYSAAPPTLSGREQIGVLDMY